MCRPSPNRLSFRSQTKPSIRGIASVGAAAGVEAVGGGIFVEQPFEAGERRGHPCSAKGGGRVASRCHAATRATVAAMRSASGAWAARANCRSGSGGAVSLNEITPAPMRPSTSGRATCIARSAGERPRSEAAHAARVEVAWIAWNTGTPAASSGEPPRARAEKAVVLTTAAGASVGRVSRSQRAVASSFRLGTKRPRARKPAA